MTFLLISVDTMTIKSPPRRLVAAGVSVRLFFVEFFYRSKTRFITFDDKSAFVNVTSLAFESAFVFGFSGRSFGDVEIIFFGSRS